MCQLKAVVERSGGVETLMESVIALEVIPNGVILTTYFEDPLTVSGVRIRRIDFLGGAVVLTEDQQEKIIEEEKE